MSATQPATYAQVCAASVSSVQHKGEAQPSILASRLTQARVNMSGGSVTEIKKREVDVVSPSDCVVPRPSLPSQPGLLSQRIMDPYTMMLPQGERTQGQDHQPHTMEFVNLSQDIVPKVQLPPLLSQWCVLLWSLRCSVSSSVFGLTAVMARAMITSIFQASNTIFYVI